MIKLCLCRLAKIPTLSLSFVPSLSRFNSYPALGESLGSAKFTQQDRSVLGVFSLAVVSNSLNGRSSKKKKHNERAVCLNNILHHV